MKSLGVIRGTVIALSLLAILVGIGVGVWVQDDIQNCHERYDDDPTIVAECEDSLTDVARGVSILGVAGGGGLVWTLYRRNS